MATQDSAPVPAAPAVPPTPQPSPRQAPKPAPKPAPKRGLLRRLLVGLAWLLLITIIGIAGGLWWLGTESGLQFVIARAQQALAGTDNKLQLSGASGSLYRGIRLDRFSWQGAGVDASGTNLMARWTLPALLERQVLIPEISAGTLVVKLPPPDPAAATTPREPVPMPGSFALPVTVDLQRFAIGELTLIPAPAADQPAPEPVVVTDLGATLSYADGRFRLAQLGATTRYGSIADSAIEIGDEAPHPLKLDLQARGLYQQLVVELKLAAGGDLERLDATVEAKAGRDGAAPAATGDATVNASARLAPLALMPLESARLRLGRIDLAGLLPQQSLPTTMIDADLSLAPAGDGWSGQLSLSNEASGALAAGRVPVSALSTRFELAHADDPLARQIRLRDLSVALIGAAKAKAGISGTVDVTPGRSLNLAGTSIPEVLAALAFDAIDVAQFAEGLPPTALGGTLALSRNDFKLELTQSAERMRALLPKDLVAAAGAAAIIAKGRIDEAALRLDEARISLGKTRIEAAGEAGLVAPYRLRFKGNARGVELAQWLPRTAPIDARWRDGRIGADWSIDGQVAPNLDAALTVKLVDSQLAGKPLAADLRSHVVLAADGSPVRLDKTAIDLQLGSNRVRAKGALGKAGDRLELDVALPDPGFFEPSVSGRLSLDGELTGTFKQLLAKVSLRGDALKLAQAGGDLRIGSLRVDASGPAAAAVPPQAPLELAVRLRSLKSGERALDSLDLKANGTLDAHRFNLAAAGEGQTLKLAGDGGAKLADAPSWRGRLASLTLDGSVPMQLAAPAAVQADAGSVRIDRFKVSVAGGEANLKRLAVDWSGQVRFDSDGSARDLPVTRLLALAGSDPKIDALKALRLDADWSVKGSGVDDLGGNARVDLREVKGAGSAAAGQSLGLDGDNGVQVTLKAGRLDGRFDLSLPSLAFTHPMTAPDLVVDGRLRLAGSVSGPISRPLFDAELTGEKLAVLQRSVGWRLTDGVLAARFDGRQIVLKTLKLAAGDGSVSLTGQAKMLDAPRPGSTAKGATKAGSKGQAADSTKASTLPFDGRFELVASRFPVPIGPGQRIALSGQTDLTSNGDGLALSGQMKVDNGIIEIQGSSAPSLPSDVTIIDTSAKAAGSSASKSRAKPSADDAQAAAVRIATDLAIDLGEQLRITGSGVVARLTGKLRVLGLLPDEPRLSGLVKIVDGSYQAYGQNLKIDKGEIRFNGPVDNPALDLTAKRPYLPVDVGVSITGTALNPRIALISTPDMSETDKLSWLVLGTDPKDAPSAAQSLALRQAAGSLLLDDDGSYKPGIAERLGLDVVNFGYGSDIGPAQGVTETMAPTGMTGGQSGSTAATQQEVVTLGKRLGSRLFVSYEQGVRGLWNLLRIQYTLTKRLAVRAQSGSDNAVDLLYSFSFD